MEWDVGAMKLTVAFHVLVLCGLTNEVRALPFRIPDFGRWIVPTLGEVWPKPQSQVSQSNFFVLRPDSFQFLVFAHFKFAINQKVESRFLKIVIKITGEKCDIIENAVNRYHETIFYPGGSARRALATNQSESFEKNSNFRDFLNYVSVSLLKPCESVPPADMDESCKYFLIKKSDVVVI